MVVGLRKNWFCTAAVLLDKTEMIGGIASFFFPVRKNKIIFDDHGPKKL